VKKKILKSISIGMTVLFIVLMANSSLVLAARGPKSKTASLNYANIGAAGIEGIVGQPNLGFGFFDKLKKSTQGAGDCLDIFASDPVTGDSVFVGIVTDSITYKDFYDDVWFLIFPEAILVEDDELEIWTKGSDIYVELSVTVSIPTTGDPYELPPFSMKIDSANEPYKAEIPTAGPFPSGWTWARITQRGYDAIVTFDCPTWGVSQGTFLGTTEFNSLDTFTPPPT
jgi:hypothetical protein